jgi:hypothetical protein
MLEVRAIAAFSSANPFWETRPPPYEIWHSPPVNLQDFNTTAVQSLIPNLQFLRASTANPNQDAILDQLHLFGGKQLAWIYVGTQYPACSTRPRMLP